MGLKIHSSHTRLPPERTWWGGRAGGPPSRWRPTRWWCTASWPPGGSRTPGWWRPWWRRWWPGPTRRGWPSRRAAAASCEVYRGTWWETANIWRGSRRPQWPGPSEARGVSHRCFAAGQINSNSNKLAAVGKVWEVPTAGNGDGATQLGLNMLNPNTIPALQGVKIEK